LNAIIVLYGAYEADQICSVRFDITCIFSCNKILSVSDMNDLGVLNPDLWLNLITNLFENCHVCQRAPSERSALAMVLWYHPRLISERSPA
jgi:hypothetical protein